MLKKPAKTILFLIKNQKIQIKIKKLNRKFPEIAIFYPGTIPYFYLRN